jgi:hypothetical protein
MRNRSRLLLPVLLGILWFEGKAVASSMVLVAGDANIVNALDGTFGSPVDLGNQQFFTNLVQAGDERLRDEVKAQHHLRHRSDANQ